jgi:hypothetical protein
MLVCPYCEQDDVWEIELAGSDRRAIMCLECDTVWDTPNDVVDGKGVNFESFMVNEGREVDWSLIKKVRKLTEKA